MEENIEVKKNKALSSIKIIPWFQGFSNDLMFYIAINTLFLTTVKNLTASQISFLTTISCLCYILLQKPFLEITKKIGNIKSVRIGTIILLLGSIIITFGKSYYTLMLGQVLYTISLLFKIMDNVILKNNLEYLDKNDEYIKYKNKSSIIYSSVTMIIALFAGKLFSINYYLPMYLCIAVCALNVLVSFRLTEEKPEESSEKTSSNRISFNKIIFIIIISYGIFYATIQTGQANSKLFIQYELEKHFDIGLTATYFSYILVASRASRVLGNIIFKKIYHRVKDKTGYGLAILCGIAFFLIILSSLISVLLLKFILMAFGFCIILGIRDVFSNYTQDLLLRNLKPSEQQSGISYLGLSRKIGETSISFIFSMMLLKLDIIYVIIALLALACISFAINYKLYMMVQKENI